MTAPKPVATTFACLYLALATPAAAAPASAIPGAGATLTLKDCRLTRPGSGGVAARCGELRVPEDYNEPQGRAIGLHVAVVPALGGGSGVEPLFVLAGGPGQAATAFYSAVAPAFGAIARTHDIVLVDQRGTGGSARLDCHFPDDFAARSPPPAEIARLSAQCLAALPHPPQYYTTSNAVRDLDAVRAALGYPSLSLYGASYGTRVAQHYARRYPHKVQALILDGVVPPQAVLGPAIAADAQRALALTLARCRDRPECRQAFGDPADDLTSLQARLAKAPVSVSVADPSTARPVTVQFGGAQLGSALRLLSYSAPSAALLPLLLHSAAGGDVGNLAAQYVLYSHELDEEIAYGMHNAVTCTEDVPYFGAADRDAMARTYLGTTEFDALVAMCASWPRGARDADLAEPLHSAVPALILSGEADPVTPPANGERAAQGFTDVVHLVLPGQGHGQLGTGCMPELMARFLKSHTTRALDTRCVGRVTPAPFFLDYAGPAP